MSEWHTPVAPISTMTSLGYGPSSCTSTSRSGWCGCSSTAACVIVETSDMVEPSNIRQDLKLTHNSCILSYTTRHISGKHQSRLELSMELKVTRYAIDSAGVATMGLHRPERRNSWTGRMHPEYRWILKQLCNDPHVRVIVLAGSGGGSSLRACTPAPPTHMS